VLYRNTDGLSVTVTNVTQTLLTYMFHYSNCSVTVTLSFIARSFSVDMQSLSMHAAEAVLRNFYGS